MRKFFSTGDLVRIPQGALLYSRVEKLDAPSYTAHIYEKTLKSNTIAIYAGKESFDLEFSKVIIHGILHYAEDADLHEGDTYVSTIN